MRGRTYAIGAVVVVVVGVSAWLGLRTPPATKQPSRAARLDVETFRRGLDEKLRRAKTLAARSRRAPPVTPAAPTDRWPTRGTGAVPTLTTALIEPRCVLGPEELCVDLAELVHRCDSGDAGDCLSVGEYLAQTPPRALIAIQFFNQACRIGDAAGCERLDVPSPEQLDCERDPFICGYVAMRSKDRALEARACEAGAADSCARLIDKDSDVTRSRAYHVRACELGLSLACAELARRLDPRCVVGEQQRVCYPPDAEQARAANTIACAAGWGSATDCER